MKSERYSLPKLLLEIASHFPERHDKETLSVLSNQSITAKINRVKRKLSGHNLSREEICIVAVLFEKFIEREKKAYATDLMKRIFKERYDRFEGLQIIYNLVRKRVFDIRSVGGRISRDKRKRYSKISLGHLVESAVLFTEPFINEVLATKEMEITSDKLPSSSNT